MFYYFSHLLLLDYVYIIPCILGIVKGSWYTQTHTKKSCTTGTSLILHHLVQHSLNALTQRLHSSYHNSCHKKCRKKSKKKRRADQLRPTLKAVPVVQVLVMQLSSFSSRLRLGQLYLLALLASRSTLQFLQFHFY